MPLVNLLSFPDFFTMCHDLQFGILYADRSLLHASSKLHYASQGQEQLGCQSPANLLF